VRRHGHREEHHVLGQASSSSDGHQSAHREDPESTEPAQPAQLVERVDVEEAAAGVAPELAPEGGEVAQPRQAKCHLAGQQQ
jgi:phage repressor protein C with HTH and peptisase S24 domain